jgi:hypothetical protein
MKNESTVNARKIAAELVQEILNGHISVAEAKDKWPDCGKYPLGDDELMVNVFRLLDHWEDDEDIRTKDEKYAEWQKDEFEKLVVKLQNVNS